MYTSTYTLLLLWNCTKLSTLKMKIVHMPVRWNEWFSDGAWAGPTASPDSLLSQVRLRFHWSTARACVSGAIALLEWASWPLVLPQQGQTYTVSHTDWFYAGHIGLCLAASPVVWRSVRNACGSAVKYHHQQYMIIIVQSVILHISTSYIHDLRRRQ